MTVAAHGIIVPLLYTADDAVKIVQAAKFPPTGARGFGSPFAQERFGLQTQAEVCIPMKSPIPTSSHDLSHILISGNKSRNAPSSCLIAQAVPKEEN